MSVQSALYSGISGLYTNGEGMAVIGNNISNVNTIGFKQGRALFSDMLSTTINQGQIGRGEQIQAVQNIFSQGSFENTGSATDLAIQGDAMFVMADSNGLGQFYSRAGAFTLDKNQVLTNPDGYQVKGYAVTAGAATGIPVPINLTTFATAPPLATANIGMVGNLNSAAAIGTSYDTSSTYYDAAGNAQSLSIRYAKTAANAWDVSTSTDGGLTYAVAGPITFNASGAINPTTLAIALPALTLNLAGTTQYSSPSQVFSQTQDGYGAGTLTKVTVDSKGFVNCMYTNGQEIPRYQVALAKFSSYDGLEKLGGSLFGETAASGAALVSPSNTNNNKVLANSLEQSNVDMADQLVKMIITQRAYSANSKTITTADQMMQDTLNLLR